MVLGRHLAEVDQQHQQSLIMNTVASVERATDSSGAASGDVGERAWPPAADPGTGIPAVMVADSKYCPDWA